MSDSTTRTMADVAIRTRGLRKTFSSSGSEVEAVRGLDLEIGQGEFFGLLGPNGAGKSTTIGMLTTLVVPTGGEARVAGVDVVRRPVEVKRRIGVMSQNNTLDRQLTVAENLEFRGRFFGMSAREARRRTDELLDLFELSERRKAKVYDLSGGQAKRIMIGRALMHRPEVLFLDEPTSGIDPQTRINLWDALRTLHAEGQTILLTTHYMEEAEALCQRIAIVDHGEMLACDTVDDLKASTGADTVFTVAYDAPTPPPLDGLADRPGVHKVEADGGQVRVFAHGANGVLTELVHAGSAAGITVRDASTLRPSLESVFLALTGREYRE
ncbi:MAG: ATP-binding cassette domain-containing protein [Streptosporangiaceae bacterium]